MLFEFVLCYNNLITPKVDGFIPNLHLRPLVFFTFMPPFMDLPGESTSRQDSCSSSNWRLHFRSTRERRNIYFPTIHISSTNHENAMPPNKHFPNLPFLLQYTPVIPRSILALTIQQTDSVLAEVTPANLNAIYQFV